MVRSELRMAPSHEAADGAAFALRLVVGFIVTLALVDFARLTIIDRNARSSEISHYAAMQRSDVRHFESIGRHSLTTAADLIKIDGVLDVLALRPDTLEVHVFDGDGVILASGDNCVVGARDTDPRIGMVIGSHEAYAGHKGDPKLDGHDFEFIAPLDLAAGGYAYEVTYDHSSVDAELAAVVRTT
jgi:hypothetical protein